MPRPTIRHSAIDFSDASAKRRFIDEVRPLSKEYDVLLKPTRKLRSLAQNRWYWGQIVHLFAEYLSDQDYNVTTDDQAHDVLRARFLAVSVVNKNTGEVLGRRVRSTTELTTEQMADYCDRCRAWLADFFGIIVPDPDPAWRSAEPTEAKRGLASRTVA